MITSFKEHSSHLRKRSKLILGPYLSTRISRQVVSIERLRKLRLSPAVLSGRISFYSAVSPLLGHPYPPSVPLSVIETGVTIPACESIS
jgi:hypothetical protein